MSNNNDITWPESCDNCPNNPENYEDTSFKSLAFNINKKNAEKHHKINVEFNQEYIIEMGGNLDE